LRRERRAVVKGLRRGVVLLGTLAIGVALLPPLQGLSPAGVRTIDAKSLPSFKVDFNADAQAIRIVLLLSPT
jgi:hypothetical protein